MGSRTYAVLISAAALVAGPAASACRDDTLWLRGDWGTCLGPNEETPCWMIFAAASCTGSCSWDGSLTQAAAGL